MAIACRVGSARWNQLARRRAVAFVNGNRITRLSCYHLDNQREGNSHVREEPFIVSESSESLYIS